MNKNERYAINKKAKCGDEIICPICGTKFIKKQYSQAFCRIKCKDSFHNGRKFERVSAYPINMRDRNDLFARKQLQEDMVFRKYVNDMLLEDDEFGCEVDLYDVYLNYCGIE